MSIFGRKVLFNLANDDPSMIWVCSVGSPREFSYKRYGLKKICDNMIKYGYTKENFENPKNLDHLKDGYYEYEKEYESHIILSTLQVNNMLKRLENIKQDKQKKDDK